jgi:hypothetical protein
VDDLAYPIGTRVRLKRDVGDAKSGAEGSVIGYYRRDPPAYAVAIDGNAVAVPPADLEAVVNED